MGDSILSSKVEISLNAISRAMRATTSGKVMSVVTVPEQTPLSRGHDRTDEKRDVLNRAMRIAEENDVPVSGTIRIGHNAADAILNTITQYDCDAVVVGWKGRRTHRRRDVILGTNVDRVVCEADCDVYVEKFGMGADADIGSILLPTAGGPHATLAAETAGAIARRTGATIHAVYVLAPDASTEAHQLGEAILSDATASLDDVTVERRLLEHDDVVAALVDESANHDLTIIGATREGLIQKFVFGTIPETVAERAQTTVIMTKRDLDLGSRLQQSIAKLRERIGGETDPLEANDGE
jgi:nucleotide-binding universal stress UspA family protein